MIYIKTSYTKKIYKIIDETQINYIDDKGSYILDCESGYDKRAKELVKYNRYKAKKSYYLRGLSVKRQ